VQNGITDRDAVQGADACSVWGPDPPWEGHY